jgi:hypothetical protein
MFVPMALSYAVTFDVATDQLRWAPVTGQLQALIDLMKGQSTPPLGTGRVLPVDAGAIDYLSIGYGAIIEERKDHLWPVNFHLSVKCIRFLRMRELWLGKNCGLEIAVARYSHS